MKTLIKTTVTALALSFTTLYASGSHSHDGGHGHSHDAPVQKEVSKTAIEEIAKQEVERLTWVKKIDKSWASMPISKMERTQYNYNNEWVVSFENAAIKDKTKQTLYIFVNVYGNLTGANYTGK
ncbi:MAG: DUF6488 family protein [Campylobacterota bacterium]